MNLTQTLSIELLEDLASALATEEPLPLELNTSVAYPMAFCVEAMTLQYIISVARKHEKKFVARFMDLTIGSEHFETSLQKGFGNPHALIAWVMAQSAEDSIGRPIEPSLAASFNSYLDAMETYDFMQTHGSVEPRANLICVQRAKREFVRSLYMGERGKSVMRPYPEIRLVVQDILSQLSPAWNGHQLREIASPLAQLLLELMQNADWWARSDTNGNFYQKGVRAVTFRLVNIDATSVLTFGGSNSHLQAYLQQSMGQLSSKAQKEGTHLTFIEMTVVDSGPGLARRWLASKSDDPTTIDSSALPSKKAETEAIAECFKKWQTSSHDVNRGVGLFSVARILRERNGFLRLRTGRTAYLFGTESAIKNVERSSRNSRRNGDYALLDDGTHVFFDKNDITFFLRPWSDATLATVEGTSYSILLPVRD